MKNENPLEEPKNGYLTNTTKKWQWLYPHCVKPQGTIALNDLDGNWRDRYDPKIFKYTEEEKEIIEY